VKLPVVDRIQPQSNKFVTGVENKATGDLKLNDSPAWCRHSGLIVSMLDSGSSSMGSSPGQGHCIVFLGKTLVHTLPLPSQTSKWVPTNLMLGRGEGNPAMNKHAIQGEVEILLHCSHFMLQKQG